MREKWKLHLQRMLAAVRGRMFNDSLDAAAIARARSSATCTAPNGVCHAPRGQIATPLKADEV
jgi:hypothetical protein